MRYRRLFSIHFHERSQEKEESTPLRYVPSFHGQTCKK